MSEGKLSGCMNKISMDKQETVKGLSGSHGKAVKVKGNQTQPHLKWLITVCIEFKFISTTNIS